MALNNISGIICVNKAGETTTIPVAELISSFSAIQDPTALSSGSVPKISQGKFVASGIVELDGGQLQFKNYNNKGSFTGKAVGLIAFDSNGNIVTYPLSTTPISNNTAANTSNLSGTFNGTPFTVPYYNSAGDDLLASDMQVNNGNWYLGSGNPFFKFGIGFGSINIDQGNIGDGYRMNGKMVITIDRENNEVMIGNSVYNTTNIENIKTSKVIFSAVGGGSITDIAADTTGNFTLTKPAKNGTYALISDIGENAWLLTANTLTAKSFLGSLNNFDVGFKRNNEEYLTLNVDGITSLKDITSSGNLTLQKGNPRLRLRDSGSGGHSQGFDLHVNGDEFLIDDNTHSKNILRNYLNSSVHTTDLDAEVFNFKNGATTYLHIQQNGDVGKGYGLSYANFYVNETRTTGDRHAFEDWSNLALTDSNLGYCSFDAKPTITNSNNYQHYVGFQSRLIYNGSGNVTEYVHGYDTDITHSGSGTISSLSGIRIRDVKGVGVITNNYGLYINNIVRGVNNYAIYSDGGQSYHKGNFGIGAIPTRKLQVTSSEVGGTIASSFSDVLIENTEFAGITLRSNDNSLSALRFNSPSGSSFGSALIVHDYTNSKLQIGTNKLGGEVHFMVDNFSHAATLNSTGLGIGTSPSNKFHVLSSSSTVAMIESSASEAYYGLKSNTGGVVYFGNKNGGDFTIQTAGSGYSDKFYITSAGNVGIGTTPSDKLSVEGGNLGIKSGNYIRLYHSTNSNYSSIYSPSSGSFSVNTGGVNDALYVASLGNVGIGTTSPSAKLHVDGAELRRNFNTSYTAISSYRNNVRDWQIDNVDGDLWHYNGSDYEFVIKKNTGYVGIKTTGPTDPLHVNGTSRTTNLKITNGATVGYAWKCTNVDGSGAWESVSTSERWKGNWDASSGVAPSASPAIGDYYTVIVAGTYGGVTFPLNSYAYYDGTSWVFRPNNYTLTTATASVLGGIKIGSDLVIDGSGVVNLATVNTNIGTFAGITVNAKGLVTGAIALTTLSGYGITNAYTKTEVDSTFANYLTTANAIANYQPLDADLTAIAGLAGTTGLLRKTAANTWALDTASYQTALSGLTTNYLSKWNGTTLANSAISEVSTNIGINTLATSSYALNHLNGGFGFNKLMELRYENTATTGLAANIWVTYSTQGKSASMQYGVGSFWRFKTDSSDTTTPIILQTNAGTSKVYLHPSLANVGINNESPTESLDVTGNIRYNNLLKPNNIAGTNGQFLGTSGTQDVWTTLTPSHISNLSSYTGFDTRYQAKDDDLTAIAGITATTGLLRKNGVNTWSLDTSNYQTSTQVSTTIDAKFYVPEDYQAGIEPMMYYNTGNARMEAMEYAWYDGNYNFFPDANGNGGNLVCGNLYPGGINFGNGFGDNGQFIKKVSGLNSWSYLVATDIPDLSNIYQTKNTTLTNLLAVTGTGFLKKTGTSSWGLETIDLTNYITRTYTGTITPNGYASGAGKVLRTTGTLDYWGTLIQDDVSFKYYEVRSDGFQYWNGLRAQGFWTGPVGTSNYNYTIKSGHNETLNRYGWSIVYPTGTYSNYFDDFGRLSYITPDGISKRYLIEGEGGGNTVSVTPSLQEVSVVGRNSNQRLQYNFIDYALVSDIVTLNQNLDSVLLNGNTANNKNIFLNGLSSAYTLGYDGTAKFYINHSIAGVLNMTQTAGTDFNINSASTMSLVSGLNMSLYGTNGLSINTPTSLNINSGNQLQISSSGHANLSFKSVGMVGYDSLALWSQQVDIYVTPSGSLSKSLKIGTNTAQADNLTSIGKDNSTDYLFINGQKYNFKLPSKSAGAKYLFNLLDFGLSTERIDIQKINTFVSGGQTYLVL